MTSAKFIAALTLSGALSLAASPNLRAAESRAPQTMKPLAAISLDAGTKHVIGYFVSAEGACKLTLAVNEGGGDAPFSTSRLQVSVDAGKSAKFDSAEGKTLLFTCKPSAQAMTAVTIDRLAYCPDAR